MRVVNLREGPGAADDSPQARFFDEFIRSG
ncbi:MAG: aldehyde ferredoxin oxidoreductase C-terminal domain-containing protein [Chloroflexi bacterium]|nr:aldehyde ferredoxin oxidoreductase C-terminal domain-containing protein [Chloroflexota bacterium]